MEKYLRLNDGTILAESYALESVYGLIVTITDPAVDIIKAFSLLSNKELTKRITYHLHKVDLEFKGYTRITSIGDENGRIIAILEKEGSENE